MTMFDYRKVRTLAQRLTGWVIFASSIACSISGEASENAPSQNGRRPNIIMLMADDHGWGDTGYHGHPFALTPNLDKMANEGLRFDRWYAAAPVCSPTRGSCLTGRHPFRYGVYHANMGHLKAEEISLAEVLHEQGYATGHFGKWHLGTLTTKIRDSNRGRPGDAADFSPPWNNGFKECFSTEAKVPTFDPMRNPPETSREARRRTEVGAFYGTHYWIAPEQYVPHNELRGDDSTLVIDRTISFVERAGQQGTPFFAVVWFHAPHTPVVADVKHRSLYPDHPKGTYGQHYHGCITAMDEQIGRLRAKLQDMGVAENTMLWYSSDNGPESSVQDGAGSAGRFRGRKRSLYEGGIRVPGLLVWPDRIKSSRISNVPCVSSDYFPTILDLLGLELPNRPYDGISLLPLIEGKNSERGIPIGFQSGDQRAWISGRYKLYSSNRGYTWELYDLVNDPGEATDIASKLPAIVNSMAVELSVWISSCQNSDAGHDYTQID